MTRETAAARDLLHRLQPYAERARSFSGWDLSWIDERPVDAVEPWNYGATVLTLARGARRVLDLGTGGGEVLASLAPSIAGAVITTEEWQVNAPLARRRLIPLGVAVLRATARQLPFPPATFDLVMDRHAALEPAEVDRVLAPGGWLVTQQVTPDTFPELRRYFPRMSVFPNHYREYTAAFSSLGYRVTLARHDYRVAYRTIGDLVGFLLIAPWYVPELTVAADTGALLAIERDLSTPAGIVLTTGRYLLTALKPACPA